MAAPTPTPDTLTPNPLYREVQWRITRALAAGEWKPGEAIPSETRLARQFGVSIGTIRRAIDELVAGRILVRQQGRGTFVATHTKTARCSISSTLSARTAAASSPSPNCSASTRSARTKATSATSASPAAPESPGCATC